MLSYDVGVLKSSLQATLSNLTWREVATQAEKWKGVMHVIMEALDYAMSEDMMDAKTEIAAIIVVTLLIDDVHFCCSNCDQEQLFQLRAIFGVTSHPWLRDYTRDPSKNFFSRSIFFASFFERAKGVVGFLQFLETENILSGSRFGQCWRNWFVIQFFLRGGKKLTWSAKSWRAVTQGILTEWRGPRLCVVIVLPRSWISIDSFPWLSSLLGIFSIFVLSFFYPHRVFLSCFSFHLGLAASTNRPPRWTVKRRRSRRLCAWSLVQLQDKHVSLSTHDNIPIRSSMFFARLRERELHSVSSIDDRSCKSRIVGHPRLRTSYCTKNWYSLFPLHGTGLPFETVSFTDLVDFDLSTRPGSRSLDRSRIQCDLRDPQRQIPQPLCRPLPNSARTSWTLNVSNRLQSRVVLEAAFASIWLLYVLFRLRKHFVILFWTASLFFYVNFTPSVGPFCTRQFDLRTKCTAVCFSATLPVLCITCSASVNSRCADTQRTHLRQHR